MSSVQYKQNTNKRWLETFNATVISKFWIPIGFLI